MLPPAVRIGMRPPDFRTDRSTFGRSTPFSREHLWALGVRRKIRVILRMMYTCVSDLAACCADSWRNEPLLTRSSPSS
jgi:hypothetical protein